jgi:hypothetical protein
MSRASAVPTCSRAIATASSHRNHRRGAVVEHVSASGTRRYAVAGVRRCRRSSNDTTSAFAAVGDQSVHRAKCSTLIPESAAALSSGSRAAGTRRANDFDSQIADSLPTYPGSFVFHPRDEICLHRLRAWSGSMTRNDRYLTTRALVETPQRTRTRAGHRRNDRQPRPLACNHGTIDVESHKTCRRTDSHVVGRQSGAAVR